MEPPKGFWASLWSFICFLPFFTALLLLGNTKGIVLCPLICLITTIGNSAILLTLWPVHVLWTYYCIISAKTVGPALKFVLCICILPVLLILWPVVGIVGSVIGGGAYGFFSPILATFSAVGEGKTNEVFHSFYDGTWSTVKGCVTVVRDFGDVCFHSYFSVMDDLQQNGPQDGKYCEIRLLYVPGTVIAGVIGVLTDFPVISLIALLKSPVMLFKGWQRLFHDLIGRDGPFLETICVPFAGLVILLWPLAVVGAVSASILSSVFLGAYAGAVVYQESSFWLGLCYVAASLSIYDEYSNDVLDMPEGSCFPRPRYRKNALLDKSDSHSLSRPSSFKNPPSRSNSFKTPILELKPFELLDSLFNECQRQGEIMISDGLITLRDIEDAKSNRGSIVISVGLPACCVLQTLLRSVKANSTGLLLRDNCTEITSSNRPKDAVFDWFVNPLLIIKEQIKAENLSESEEVYLCKLVLLSSHTVKLKNIDIGSPPESERKLAELEALARRLRGITKSISRYPTFRRRFESIVNKICEELGKKNGSSKSTSETPTISRSKSAFGRLISQKSFKIKTNNHGFDHESQLV